MRLYLSSFRLGDHPDRLLDLVGDDRRTAVVCNAIDGLDEGERKERVEAEVAALGDLGMDAEELDLRAYFGTDGTAIRDHLRGYGVVWVRGGNTFVLRRAAAASGFDRAIVDLLAGDALVYGGYSAGVCLLAPSLAGIDLCDDTDEEPPGYEGIAGSPDGLGVLPFAVAPHHRSPDHPETDVMDRVVAWFVDQRVPFVALRDGDVLIQDGDQQWVAFGENAG
jgi:dipeptidase E